MSKLQEKSKLHVKRGDTVIVTSGKDKGKVGTVKQSLPKDGKLLVEGINMVTKATKSNPMKGIQGGLIKKESPIRSSKVMLYCVKCEKATRIRHLELDSGAKTRVCKHCNEQLDV
jgi:large subunit ribosomal protein L24